VARSNPFTIDRTAHEEIGFFPGAYSSSNEVPNLCRGRARCRPVRPFECLFLRRCHRFRRLLAAYLALDEDVAISPRLLGTLSGHLFGGFVSLSADRDPLALLRFHSHLDYQNGATHNPAMTTPFRPSRGSFQTGSCPTTSRLAAHRAPRTGSPFSMPHVAPLDSPIGRWDRRCRVCSYWPSSVQAAFHLVFSTTHVPSWRQMIFR